MKSPKDEHRQTVGEWLSRPFEWRIPVYQRHYAWDSADESGPIHLFYETVEEQTEYRLEGETPDQHYLGSVLVDNKTERGSTSSIKHYDVVDGQQRLTTIQIALLALVRVADEKGFGNQLKLELEKYIFSDKLSNLHRPRLHPTNFDEKQFRKVLFDAYDIVMDVGSREVSRENARRSKIVSAFEFFQGKYELLVKRHSQHEPEEIILKIMKTLTQGFDFVLIVLRESDKAQRIFESLNNFAKPLTTFDLIRNNVFERASRLHPGMDEELFYSKAWQQLEKPYWESKADQRRGGNTHIEAYIARMLVAKTRKEFGFNRNDIFKIYKKFREDFPSIDAEINALVDYVDIYQYLDSATDNNPVAPEVDFGVFRYKIWKNRDFYPALFLISLSDSNILQKQRMIRILECYVIRRGVCGLSTNHYNLYTASICRVLGDNPSYEKLHKELKESEKDSTVFPKDGRVKADCVSKKFYGSAFQRYALEEVEKSMHNPRAERVIVAEGDITIDHILPQGWGKNKMWRSIVLGDDDSPEQELVVNSYLDTIGNLTLMSGPNNSIKSNRPLEEVKELLFEENTVKLNSELAKEESWNHEKIAARSKWLAEKICEIWPYDVPE